MKGIRDFTRTCIVIYEGPYLSVLTDLVALRGPVRVPG